MKAIVITSIFAPTQQVRAFAELKDYEVIVVGDKKSPEGYDCATARFISANEQAAMSWKMIESLPWNHYGRKMIGYLEAMKAGAEVIIDTDDDNAPLEGWSFPNFEGRFQTSLEGAGFVNIYSSYSDAHIWPRGFPLDRILEPASKLPSLGEKDVKVGIWQGLANGDPDVDAIYRLTINKLCTFEEKPPIVLAPHTVCPFNSQNTAFQRELFALLYLPAFVTFRFTDILRGLVAQPILWATEFRLGFTNATVYQDRNPHNYLRDFESEIPCYLHPQLVIEEVGKAVTEGSSVADNLHAAYAALERANIIKADEVKLVDSWLADVQSVIAP